eukprot:RCo010641
MAENYALQDCSGDTHELRDELVDVRTFVGVWNEFTFFIRCLYQRIHPAELRIGAALSHLIRADNKHALPMNGAKLKANLGFDLRGRKKEATRGQSAFQSLSLSLSLYCCWSSVRHKEEMKTLQKVGRGAIASVWPAILGSCTKEAPPRVPGGRSPLQAFRRASIMVVFPAPLCPRITVKGAKNRICCFSRWALSGFGLKDRIPCRYKNSIEVIPRHQQKCTKQKYDQKNSCEKM